MIDRWMVMMSVGATQRDDGKGDWLPADGEGYTLFGWGDCGQPGCDNNMALEGGSWHQSRSAGSTATHMSDAAGAS